jgi:Uma2 family endonuclease
MATVNEPVVAPTVELIDNDGVPLETDWHRGEINLLVESLRHHFRLRNDFFAGGNMFIYYSVEQARNRDYRGPDFFYVDGVERNRDRRWWAVWDEGGRYPDVIVELSSPTTAEVDRTVRFQLYERVFHTREYYCYDPDEQLLEGWRLNAEGSYQAIPANEQGWLRSHELRLWLGTWFGKYLETETTWLRFYDDSRRPVLTAAETAEGTLQAAEARAEAAETRAQTLEAQLAELREQLARQQKPPE